MTEAQVPLDGDGQRHEDGARHRDVRHGVHEIRKYVGVAVGGHKKSSESVGNASEDDEEDVKAGESQQKPVENIS